MTSALSSNERNYKKLPLSKEYYDLKDQGKLSAPKKIAKKVLQQNGSTLTSQNSSSSSLSSSVSISSSLDSSPSPQSSVSKVSKSILSKDLGSVNPAQGQKTLAEPRSLQTPAKKEGEEVESAPITTKQLDLQWLKKDQRTLLLTLFKEYALDDEIRLYDLLGLHIHNLLDQFKKSFTSFTSVSPIHWEKMLNSFVITEFHQRYLSLYVSLITAIHTTQSSELDPDYDTLDPMHFVKRGNIPSYFNTVKENLDQLISSLKDEHDSHKRIKSPQEKLKARLLEKIKLQLVPIHTSLELMRAFLANDVRSQSLLSPLSDFPGSETIPKNPMQTRDCLINWMRFISQASIALVKSPHIRCNFSRIVCNIPLEYLPNLITKNQTIDKRNLASIHTWYKKMPQDLIRGFGIPTTNHFTSVINDKLSYEEYCKLATVTPKTPYLTHNQVVSMLYHEGNHSKLFNAFVNDFVRIMENNILSPLSNGTYVTSSAWIQSISYFIVRIADSQTFMIEPYEKGPISPLLAKSFKSFDRHLQEGLTTLLDELKTAFSQEPIQSEILEYISMAQSIQYNPLMLYMVWMDLLTKLKPVLEMQSMVFDRLRDLWHTSLSKLKSKDGLSIEDKHVISRHFRKAIEPFFPYIFLMDRAQILLDGRELDITEAELVVPIDLLNLLMFTEKDFSRNHLLPSEKGPDGKISLQKPSMPKAKAILASALTRKEKRELEELSHREPRKPIEASPDALHEIRGREELLNYLVKKGFLPTKSKHRGSHMVFQDPAKKTTVVVPKGKDDRLAPGTMHSIKQQVQSGKESETIVIQKRIQKKKKKGKNMHKSLESI